MSITANSSELDDRVLRSVEKDADSFARIPEVRGVVRARRAMRTALTMLQHQVSAHKQQSDDWDAGLTC